MSNELNQQIISIKEELKECKRKLKKLNKKLKYLNLLSDNNEEPMPSNFNKITNKNLEREKSINYTKKLLINLKKRSHILNFNYKIKKEVMEEIEIPSLEYA